MRSEELIGRLSAELRPVRRMPRPAWQALIWLTLAASAIAVAVAWAGFRPDIGQRMQLAFDVGQWIAAILTGIAAAFAAAMLARPDRPASWAWLPVPPLAAWFATLGWGCMADLDRLGPDAMRPHTSWSCFRFILGLGTPLTAALLLLLRHAGPVRPTPVLVLSGLASAALCSAGLTLFHYLDAALMVLLWHGCAAAAVAAMGLLLGRPLLVPAPSLPA